VFNDVETTTTSTTFRTAYMSVPTPYFKPFYISSSKVNANIFTL
jgi:hypothetical protein